MTSVDKESNGESVSPLSGMHPVLRGLCVRCTLFLVWVLVVTLPLRMALLAAWLRVSLMLRALWLVPRVMYIEDRPLIHPRLLMYLADELGEDRTRFLMRAHRYPRMVEEELGASFEALSVERGCVAEVEVFLVVKRDYGAPRWRLNGVGLVGEDG